MKIFYLVNSLSFFASHRIPLALSAVAFGHKVFVGYGELGDFRLSDLQSGIVPIKIRMWRGGLNPVKDLISLFDIWLAFRRHRPDIVHLVTIKPYLFGGVAARVADIPAVVTAVAGLGASVLHTNMSGKFFRIALFPLFRVAFGHFNQRVIVQNCHDSSTLIDWGVLCASKIRLIRGSGVDLTKFLSLSESGGLPVVCFAARLIREKGVYDFVSAARLLKARGVRARFWLAGEPDLKNPSGLSKYEIQTIRDEGLVEVLGFRNDMPFLYSQSHIICLPSFYGEGVPKALIEAAAAGRAVVTTDHPGCHDAITPGVTGLLVPVKNPEKLADALQWLIEHPKERVAMGQAGRQLAEREFAIEKIVEKHWDIYLELLGNAA